MAETPMMVQYRNFKKQYADAVLFFRVGDFYEMFDSDALEVSALLNLTLTHKGDDPMCGIPYHAAKNYIKRLLDCGKKIAVCEQLEINDKGLADRDIVRIVTPATVTEDGFFEQNSSNFVICFFQTSCAFCDITTGDFFLRHLDSKNRLQSIREMIQQLMPSEILVCDDEYFTIRDFKAVIDNCSVMVTKLPSWYFTLKKCSEFLCEHLKIKSVRIFGIDDSDKVVCSAGALLRYVKETAKNQLSQISSYKLVDESFFLSIDESSRKNLELFNNLYDGSAKYTLFDSINKCKTFSGQRLLKNWVSFPLHNIREIQFRQQWTEFFVRNKDEYNRVKSLISSALDLNRLTTRVLMKNAVPHDLVGIKQTICTFFNIVSDNPERYEKLFDENINSNSLSAVSALATEIDNSINDEFLGQFSTGEVIKDGYDEELDKLRSIKENSDSILQSYLDGEKEKLGLSILKLGYNKIYGYYIEIPKGQINKAPDYFFRRQTLVNGERYTTEKLQEYEKEIMSSVAMTEERERLLFEKVCKHAADIKDILNSIGIFISNLDVFQSFATLARDYDYTCPEVTEEDVLIIRDGRHPVVEKQTGRTDFVANSLEMDSRFFLITGPNMAGKSTFLRQNALIILLAHIGSFVPASYAKVGLTDRIFCRVGASDNLARGESTFLVEMQETAFILRNCTERSFVIVDEIGRGTSTQDGMAIAYAVMKNLIAKNCKTLFATHYHELTLMNTSGISLKTLLVEEKNGEVTFLRKVIDGTANSSYGIHVAKLAGVPASVLKDAKNFQNSHFEDYSMQQKSLFTSEAEVSEPVSENNTTELVKALEDIDIDSVTPMQALILLSHLKELCEN